MSSIDMQKGVDNFTDPIILICRYDSDQTIAVKIP